MKNHAKQFISPPHLISVKQNAYLWSSIPDWLKYFISNNVDAIFIDVQSVKWV